MDGVWMMGRPVTILADVGDEQEVIAEERQNWLHRVLIALGADKEIISSNTMGAKRHLAELDLIVWRHVDGMIRIYRPQYAWVEMPGELEGSVTEAPIETDKKLLAEWRPPTLIKVREGNGRQHYRITLREWALPFQMGEE